MPLRSQSVQSTMRSPLLRLVVVATLFVASGSRVLCQGVEEELQVSGNPPARLRGGPTSNLAARNVAPPHPVVVERWDEPVMESCPRAFRWFFAELWNIMKELYGIYRHPLQNIPSNAPEIETVFGYPRDYFPDGFHELPPKMKAELYRDVLP